MGAVGGAGGCVLALPSSAAGAAVGGVDGDSLIGGREQSILERQEGQPKGEKAFTRCNVVVAAECVTRLVVGRTPSVASSHWQCHRWRHSPGRMQRPRGRSGANDPTVECCFRPHCCRNVCPPSLRMTLVLDLDETLIRSNMDPRRDCNYDMQLSVHIDSLPVKFYVKKRPYLDLFLRNVTASHCPLRSSHAPHRWRTAAGEFMV